jgi:hypothetical protein
MKANYQGNPTKEQKANNYGRKFYRWIKLLEKGLD